MSRHYVFNGERAFVYGYDRPLRHYFFQVMLGNEVLEDDGFGGCTGQELIDAANRWGVLIPGEHAAAACLDVPITDDSNGGGSINIEVFDGLAVTLQAEAEVNMLEEDPQ